MQLNYLLLYNRFHHLTALVSCSITLRYSDFATFPDISNYFGEHSVIIPFRMAKTSKMRHVL